MRIGLTFTAAVVAVAVSAALPAAAQAPAGAPQGARPAAAAQQAAGRIAGTVTSASGQPLQAASVAVYGADDKLVTGAFTGADGAFRLDGLRPGSYTVKVSALGFTTLTRPAVTLAEGSLQVELGRVQLAASAVQIEGIAVQAERREVTLAPDRNSYAVKDMPSTQGGNAVDVLRNVPSVEVDGDNNVSLRGNQNVVVQINGRPTPMTGAQLGSYLAQLPANLLDRVEVVPNPSAKYDPEGMAGIVNIALKQNADLGLSGGFSASGGSTGQANVNGNLGYQAGPLTLFGSVGVMHDERQTSGFNDIASFDANAAPIFSQEQDIAGAGSGNSQTVNASAEYKLSPRNAVSSTLLLSNRGNARSTDNLLQRYDAAGELTGFANQENTGTGDDFTLDYTLGFRRVVQPRANELSVLLGYTRGSFIDSSSLLSPSLAALGETDATPTQMNSAPSSWRNAFTLQADWTRALAERTKLELGYKGTLRLTDSQVAVDTFNYALNAFEADASQSNAFEYDDQVHAVYGLLSQNLGKFDLQGGVRLEQAMTSFDLTTTGQTFENDYRSLFPSAVIAYNLSDDQQVRASYSQRITRPDTRSLNPFVRFEDAQNLSQGNPYLTPEYTDAYELSFQQSADWGSLQLSPFYRHTEDAVRRIRSVDASTGVTTTTFANVATANSFGTDLTASLRLGKLTGFGGASLYRQVTDASNVASDASTNALGWSARANATYQATPSLTVQASYNYRAPMSVEQGRMSSQSMLNLGLTQKLNDRSRLTLRVTDPFDQMGSTFVSTNPLLQQITERSFGARGVSLSYSYSFGQQPRVRATAVPAEAQDEGER